MQDLWLEIQTESGGRKKELLLKPVTRSLREAEETSSAPDCCTASPASAEMAVPCLPCRAPAYQLLGPLFPARNLRLTQRQQTAAAKKQIPSLSSQRSAASFWPPAASRMSNNNRKPDPDRRIATLSSLRRDNESAGSESDEDNNQQAFYAGGSDRSGQQILGPPEKKKDSQQLVKEMFQSAREHGGQVVDETAGSTSSRRLFSGAGFRLGDDMSHPVLQQPAPASEAHSAVPPSVTMILKMWRDGFSVDDGPLRSYREPENAEFLSSIRRGEIPHELLAAAQGGEVNLNMEDHQTEEFVVVRKPVRAFGGEGHRLGTVTPAIALADPVGDPKENAAAAQAELNVDELQPVTSIQVRLSDSSRLVMRINTEQPVRRIREFICRARPEMGATPFGLMTSFPHKALEDETQSIAEANLQHASVVQRLL